MHRKNMNKNPDFIIEQLEEALEERQGSDRRKNNHGVDPLSGADRRKNDRRSDAKLSTKR